MQLPEPFTRYLVESTEECVACVLDLLCRPGERGAFGRDGQEHVRRGFLLPRLGRDELRLIKDLL